MKLNPLTTRIRAAHADAWEVEGRARIGYGGGWARFPNVRLMASGIARAKWNNADITGPGADLDRVVAWYGERDIPWGIRDPLELDVSFGSHLFVKRCLAIRADTFRDRGSDPRIRRAEATQLELLARLDAMGSGAVDESRAWIGPQLGAPGFTHWIAEFRSQPAGIATSVRSNGDAGPAAYITGVRAPDDEIREALIATASLHAFSEGADLVHANPWTDTEAGLFLGLGAVEVPGLEVRLVRPD